MAAFEVSTEDAAYDNDPDLEDLLHTPNGENVGKTDKYGSFLYPQIWSESQPADNIIDCGAGTLVHEIGHQFGLEHSEAGIMLKGCFSLDRFFLPQELAAIRSKKGMTQ